jgi:hypothetical protein
VVWMPVARLMTLSILPCASWPFGWFMATPPWTSRSHLSLFWGDMSIQTLSLFLIKLSFY